MVLKLSEQVRRLEDTIESLRLENKMLKEDTVDIRDEVIDHQKRDIVELRKKIDKLKEELGARVKQVEDLQSSYKTLQEENKKLKSKLEQMTDEYDEDYQTFHNNCKYTKKHGEEELHPYGRSIADYIDINDERFKKIFRDFLGDDLF